MRQVVQLTYTKNCSFEEILTEAIFIQSITVGRQQNLYPVTPNVGEFKLEVV